MFLFKEGWSVTVLTSSLELILLTVSPTQKRKKKEIKIIYYVISWNTVYLTPTASFKALLKIQSETIQER